MALQVEEGAQTLSLGTWEQSALAKQAFLELVETLLGQGVTGVHVGASHTVRVSVEDALGAAADRVYKIEAEVQRRYPEAELDVWVSEAA